jgi:hypothetical protein
MKSGDECMLPALLDKEISFENENCRLRITCFQGDYLITVNQYSDDILVVLKTKLFLHFGHRNTRFKDVYYSYRHNGLNEVAEIFRELAFRLYGEGNWSNNDRKRRGFTSISLKFLRCD